MKHKLNIAAILGLAEQLASVALIGGYWQISVLGQ
jgi:hypothetical protein